MIHIRQLIAQLEKFPQDSYCFAYEGEVHGVIVVAADGKRQLGYVPAKEGVQDDDEAVFD